jgi:hypothetical protein
MKLQWEKPEELALLEQQPQQKPLIQQPQAQPHVLPSAQQVRQAQQIQLQAQLQTQLRHQQQLQHPTLSSSVSAFNMYIYIFPKLLVISFLNM